MHLCDIVYGIVFLRTEVLRYMFVLMLGILVCGVGNLAAREGYATFEQITVEDGLSQSTVYSIMQDSEGYMWFGTNAGLNQYFGYEFKVYQNSHDEWSSLSNNRINALAEDSAGYIWVGTGHGLNRLNPQTRKTLRYPRDFEGTTQLTTEYILDLFALTDSTLWIATAWGLNRYNTHQDSLTQFPETFSQAADSVDMSRLFDIYYDGHGKLLLASDHGVRFFDITQERFTQPYGDSREFFQKIEPLGINCIIGDSDREFWIGTDNGLYHYDRTTGEVAHYTEDLEDPGSLSKQGVLSLFVDNDSTLWVGTDWGLNRFEPETGDFIQYLHKGGNQYSLSGNGVQEIYQDQGGVLWFGTLHNGVSKYVPSKQAFHNYQSLTTPSDELLLDKNVLSIEELNNGDIWLGTYTGLYAINDELQTLERIQPDGCEFVNDYFLYIYEDRRGAVWLSTFDNNNPRLHVYNPQTGECRLFRYDPDDPGSLLAQVNVILEDQAGTIWLGMEGEGLGRLNRQTGKITYYKTDYNDSTGIAGNWIDDIYEDHQGRLWIATDSGLNWFDTESETFTTMPVRPDDPRGLSNSRVTDLFEDQENTLWIGTIDGLNAYDYTTGDFTVYGEQHGLKSGNIYGIVEDHAGDLWVSTPKGIARFQKDSNTFTAFGRSDGVIITDFNIGSCARSSSGEVYFGGRKGLISFQPEVLNPPATQPPVDITSFRIYDEPRLIPETGTIQLDHTQKFFSFEFAVLDYTHPEQNQYKYYLEGLDTKWRNAGSRRYANYTNVSPGEYIFRVKGANAWGEWNTAQPVRLKIVPPFWQTAWFQILAGLAVVGAVGFGYRMRVHQIARRERELEEEVRRRTHQIQQQNEEIERGREALAAEKERLAVTLYSIGDGVITTDMNGNVVLLNSVAEELTGWSQEEAQGKPLQEIFHIVHEYSGKELPNPAEKVLETESVVELANHTMLIARDGTERVIADSGAPIKDQQDRIIGVVLVFRDITHERQMEEEIHKTEKLRSVGILAGGIAHDFNNVLAVIVGNLSLSKLCLPEDDEELKEYIETAEEATWRAKELTQQLLTLSKGGEPVRKVSGIRDPVQEAVEMALRGSNVHCEFTFADDLYPVVIDDDQIRQVVKNMVINANQAMPDGGSIRVEGVNLDLEERSGLPLESGAYVRININDEGEGIPREQQKKVFDPYYTTKESSSGLGLFVAYSIISKHDGFLTVDSEPGEGATFSIYLPAAEGEIVEEAESDNRTSEEEISQGNGESLEDEQGNILAMDDEDGVRMILEDMLSTLGYDITTATNGEEAIEYYRQALEQGHKFDAVVLDLTIQGGMGGKETIEHLREIDPNVKAIVSSGYSNDPIMANYKEYGFRDRVPKPYKLDEMRRTIHRIVHSD